MPLLAAFLGSAIASLAAFFGKFLVERVAVSLASFLAWLGVLTAFIVSVSACLTALSNAVTSSVPSDVGWLSFFWMGLGMFIPANAGAVLSCLGSVWIGTEVYKIRKTGIQVFAR